MWWAICVLKATTVKEGLRKKPHVLLVNMELLLDLYQRTAVNYVTEVNIVQVMVPQAALSIVMLASIVMEVLKSQLPLIF